MKHPSTRSQPGVTQTVPSGDLRARGETLTDSIIADLATLAAHVLGVAYQRGGVDPGELVRADALVGDKPVSQASVRDINAAARAAYVAKKASHSRAPAALGETLRSAHERGGRPSARTAAS